MLVWNVYYFNFYNYLQNIFTVHDCRRTLYKENMIEAEDDCTKNGKYVYIGVNHFPKERQN